MSNASNISAMDDCLPYSDYSNLSSYVDEKGNMSNSSCYDDSDWCQVDEHQEAAIKMFQTCFLCVIFLFGITGNCLVMATFAMYRRLRLRSMTDIFLFHLALADLLLLLTVPLQVVDTQLGTWVFSSSLCKAMRACYAINTYSGLLLLACISVDRYMVVARAQDMLRLRSQVLTAGMLGAVGVWLFAVLLSTPEILYSGVYESDEGAFCVMQISGHVKMATNGAIIALFCVSLFVMVMCYSSIAWVLREGHAQRRGKRWHRQRTLKLMVALVLIFLIFQLPYTMVLSRKIAGQFCGLLLEYITCTLAYTRCCLNPILYGLVGVRFRKDVIQLIHDAGCQCGAQQWSKTPNSSSMSASSPALTMLSACSPASPTSPAERSYSSNDAAPPIKFQFPASK